MKWILFTLVVISVIFITGCEEISWEEVMKEIAAMKWAYGKGTMLCSSERPFYAGLPGFGACMTETEFHSYHELTQKEKHSELADAYAKKVKAVNEGKENCAKTPEKPYYVGGIGGFFGECLSEKDFTTSLLKKYPEIIKHPLPPVSAGSSIIGPAVKPLVEALQCSKPTECKSICMGTYIQHRTCDTLTKFCKETTKEQCNTDETCILGVSGPACTKAFHVQDKRCPPGAYYDVRNERCITCGKNALPTAEGKCRCVTDSYVPDIAGGCREKTSTEKQQETPPSVRECTFSTDCKKSNPDMDTCLDKTHKRRYDCINYKCVPYDFACGRGCDKGECLP